MSEPRRRTRTDGLKPAFEQLSDGVSTLVKQHIELARHEIKQDVKTNGRRAAIIAVCGVIAVIGWVLLNLAAIGLAIWLGGMLAGWIVAGVLALIHLIVAGAAAAYFGKKLREDKPLDLAQTTDELEEDKQWLKRIGESRKNGKKTTTNKPPSRGQLPPS
ncbi:MAG: phage holin family protein [Persicimonas sp.]